MHAASNKLLTLGIAVALGLGMAVTALAGPPYDAGYKARGMKERNTGTHVFRTYAAPPWSAQPQAQRAFSYQPQAQYAVSTACVPVKVADGVPAVQASQRRFSDAPAAPAPVYRDFGRGYRTNSGNSGLGGAYRSKALLYK